MLLPQSGHYIARNVLQPDSPDHRPIIEEGAYFMDYALAIYTWMLYVFMDPLLGFPKLGMRRVANMKPTRTEKGGAFLSARHFLPCAPHPQCSFFRSLPPHPGPYLLSLHFFVLTTDPFLSHMLLTAMRSVYGDNCFRGHEAAILNFLQERQCEVGDQYTQPSS